MSLPDNLTFYSLPGVPRLIWSNRAHQLFGEHCYFYLLSSEDARGGNLIESVQRISQEMGIGSPTSHIVFGPLDALVRIWLPDDLRESFLRNLQSPAEKFDLESILEFRSNHIEYLWSEDSACNLSHVNEPAIDIESAKQDIELVTSRPDSPDVAGAVVRLREARLLTTFTADPGVKTYMFLYKDEGTSIDDPSRQSCEIANTAQALGLGNVSIYYGEGFCDFVLKGVLPSYSAVNTFVQSFQDALAERSLYGWTLAPADYGRVPEGETINLPQEQAAALTLRLAKGGPNERAVRVTLADERVRDNVTRLLAYAGERLDPRETLRFESILGGLLSRNRRAINQRLSFVISIESGLRDLIPLLAAQHFPDDQEWIKEIPVDLLEKSRGPNSFDRQPEGDDLRSWLRSADLPILFGYLRNMYLASARIRDLMDEYMDRDEWVARSRDLVDLRFQYTHGLLLESALDNAFDEDFWTAVETIIPAIAVQIGIERILEVSSEIRS